MNISQLLDITLSRQASDLHLVVGYPPQIRIFGELIAIQGHPVLTGQDMELMIQSLLSPVQKDQLHKNWELDLGLDYQSKVRFRVNIYRTLGHYAASLRAIPNQILSLGELGLPENVVRLTDLKQGLVLVTGPTGQGKSTTLAAMVNHVNQTKPVHIITIEDPIEFTYPHALATISQREVSSDTLSWTNALKYSLRQDPDVVLVGEIRDLETMSAAMTIAETGHLVFATLHTNSAAQTIDRIIDIFPQDQQPQIRTQLAAVLEAVIAQRLVPSINPGRVMAAEILYGIPSVRAIIRDGNTHLIDNLIQTSAEYGMTLLESSLTRLVREGKITAVTAQNFALRPQILSKLLKI